jgi:lambda family phage minor tail protein L
MAPLPNIPVSILQEKNQLATNERFIWLYEITVPTDPITVYRLARETEAIEFKGYTFSPFPISHDTVERDRTGDLPSTSLVVSNMSREVISTLELYDGLVGQTVRIYLTHSLLLASSQWIGEEDFEVLSSSATADSVQLSLGSTNLFDSKIPKQRMMRFHCRHRYQSPECGYSLVSTDPNYLASCDKSLSGPNGCEAHGASYTDAGLTPIHPDRFGGFPGIPTPTTGGGL